MYDYAQSVWSLVNGQVSAATDACAVFVVCVVMWIRCPYCVQWSSICGVCNDVDQMPLLCVVMWIRCPYCVQWSGVCVVQALAGRKAPHGQVCPWQGRRCWQRTASRAEQQPLVSWICRKWSQRWFSLCLSFVFFVLFYCSWCTESLSVLFLFYSSWCTESLSFAIFFSFLLFMVYRFFVCPLLSSSVFHSLWCRNSLYFAIFFTIYGVQIWADSVV